MDNVKDFKKGAIKVVLQERVDRVDFVREFGARGVPVNNGRIIDPTR